MEAHDAALVLGHDRAVQFIPRTEADFDQAGQLGARDVPFAMRAAYLAAIEQQNPPAVAPRHHRRVDQAQAAARVDQVNVGYRWRAAGRRLGVDRRGPSGVWVGGAVTRTTPIGRPSTDVVP